MRTARIRNIPYAQLFADHYGHGPEEAQSGAFISEWCSPERPFDTTLLLPPANCLYICDFTYFRYFPRILFFERYQGIAQRLCRGIDRWRTSWTQSFVTRLSQLSMMSMI